MVNPQRESAVYKRAYAAWVAGGLSRRAAGVLVDNDITDFDQIRAMSDERIGRLSKIGPALTDEIIRWRSASVAEQSAIASTRCTSDMVLRDLVAAMSCVMAGDLAGAEAMATAAAERTHEMRLAGQPI